jgi:hypothetical protein
MIETLQEAAPQGAVVLKTWRCGHPKTLENTGGVCPSKPGGRCRTCFRASNARYRASEKGRAAQRAALRRYDASAKRCAARQRYNDSVKGILRNVRVNANRRGMPR